MENVATAEGVCVFCRLKPLNNDNIKSCIQYENHFTVNAVPPEINRKNTKEIKFTFTKVFNENSSQSEVFNDVAFPLVKDLLNSKNGLLFAYGVTGSGKTFSMEGVIENPGIIGRTIKSLFRRLNFIKRFLIKPDERNGFRILEETDAMLEIVNNKNKYSRRSGDHDCVTYMNAISDDPFEVNKVDNCTVFVSMVEIYGNNINDLFIGRKETSREVTVKEDKKSNMYLHNVKEVEVQSDSEAIYWFRKGERNRRIAETNLNHNSSRSHCIFNIRLVKLNNKDSNDEFLSVNQLSLIDLAGSERAKRTGASGAQLKEAGDINNSLMELQSIMSKLREKHKTGSKDIIHYRGNKLTHLLKTSFESNCKVRMIVCVQQKPEEYNETLNVLSFAEDSKEIRIVTRNDNPATQKKPLKLSSTVKNEPIPIVSEIDIEKTCQELDTCLEKVKKYREIEKNTRDVYLAVIEISRILSKIRTLQSIIIKYRKDLYKECEYEEDSDNENIISELSEKLREKDREISKLKQQSVDKSEIKTAYNGRILTNYMTNGVRKSLRANPKASVKNLANHFEMKSAVKTETPKTWPSKPHYNTRYNHQKENYLVHKDKNEIPTGTLNKFQVKKSVVSTNIKMKELGKASKYLLQRQSGTNDEFQTDYIEGNVTPTAGGGYAVELTGIETVKQSPYNNTRKRVSSNTETSEYKKSKKEFQ